MEFNFANYLESVAMNPFEKYQQQSRDNFVRTVGLSLEQFQSLVELIKVYLQDQKQNCPLSRRGLKSKLSMENQLLLTLLYRRDYPTFIKLGLQFGLSESYANKIYHKISTIMVKILHVKNRQALLEDNLETRVVDVTEQPLERPQKGQKAYFSGKKKTSPQSPTDYLSNHFSYFKSLL